MGSRPAQRICRCGHSQGRFSTIISTNLRFFWAWVQDSWTSTQPPVGAAHTLHRPGATSHAAERTVRGASRGHLSQLPSLRDAGLVGPERVITSSQWPEFWHLALSQERRGTSLAVRWLKLCASTARGAGSIPGWRTKILYANLWEQKVFCFEVLTSESIFQALYIQWGHHISHPFYNKMFSISAKLRSSAFEQ